MTLALPTLTTRTIEGKNGEGLVGELMTRLQFCWPPDGQGDGRPEDERHTGGAGMVLWHK